jgi:hypothetical protein
MDNERNKFVSAMINADDDAARAGVLLEAPVFVLMRWRDAFARCCHHAAFDAGVAYLDAWHDSLSNTRQLGGFRGDLIGSAQMPLLYLVEQARPDRGLEP